MNKYTPWNNRGCKYPSTMEKSDSKIKTWEDLDEGEGKKRAERIGRRNSIDEEIYYKRLS